VKYFVRQYDDLFVKIELSRFQSMGNRMDEWRLKCPNGIGKKIMRKGDGK
jgi:hypothetical protein